MKITIEYKDGETPFFLKENKERGRISEINIEKNICNTPPKFMFYEVLKNISIPKNEKIIANDTPYVGWSFLDTKGENIIDEISKIILLDSNGYEGRIEMTSSNIVQEHGYNLYVKKYSFLYGNYKIRLVENGEIFYNKKKFETSKIVNEPRVFTEEFPDDFLKKIMEEGSSDDE